MKMDRLRACRMIVVVTLLVTTSVMWLSCSEDKKSAPAAELSDAELADATGLPEAVMGLVRLAGGQRLAPLMRSSGGQAAGLRFEAPMDDTHNSLRTSLNQSLEPHGCRVYIVAMVMRVAPNDTSARPLNVYAVLPSMDMFEPLRVMGTSLTTVHDTEGLIEALRTLGERVPIDVAAAGEDFLNVQFQGPAYPEWGALAKELFALYPEATKPWWATPEELAKEMEECQCLDLAMD